MTQRGMLTFKPHLKFLVAKYNSEVSDGQKFILRHSENPTRAQTSQFEYDANPTHFIGHIVKEYDRLNSHEEGSFNSRS